MDEYQPKATNTGAQRGALEGLCSVNGGDDVPCVATDLMQDKLTVRCQATAAFADEAVLSLPHIGLLKAAVAHVFEGGFTLAFEPAPQSKLGLYLDWLENRSRTDGSADARYFQRIVPIKRLVALERDGDSTSLVRIVDLSRSGVAFTSSKPFREDEKVRIGDYSGIIVRLFEGGAAAHFDQPIDEMAFDVMIDLDKAHAPKPARIDRGLSGDFPQTREPWTTTSATELASRDSNQGRPQG